MTILSVNKTRALLRGDLWALMGAECALFVYGDSLTVPIFFTPGGPLMNQKSRFITRAAVIGAMYFAITHMQNLLLPGSATWAIQCRVSEALCVLAFFTPTAIPGLTVGCLIFNLSYAGALPLDFLVGSLATFLATLFMWLTRNVRLFGFPVIGMAMPALFNALLVGWELTVYLGDTGFTMAAFWINAVYVAIGELIVLFTVGTFVWRALTKNQMGKRIFG